MGFSLIAEGLLRAHLPDALWTLLISRLEYVVNYFVRADRQRRGWGRVRRPPGARAARPWSGEVTAAEVRQVMLPT